MRQLNLTKNKCLNCSNPLDLTEDTAQEEPNETQQTEAAEFEQEVEVEAETELVSDPRQIPLATHYVVEYLPNTANGESFNLGIEPKITGAYSGNITSQTASNLIAQYTLAKKTPAPSSDKTNNTVVKRETLKAESSATQQTQKKGQEKPLEKPMPHHSIHLASSNPYRDTIEELETSTMDSEQWALDLLREEERQFFLDKEKQQQANRENAETKEDVPNSKRQARNNLAAANGVNDQWEQAMQEIGIEETWVLTLFEPEERINIAKQLIIDKLQSINSQQAYG